MYPGHRGRGGPAGHPLANPHVVGKPCRACDGAVHTAAGAVRLYRGHLLASPDLLALLPAVRGRVLGCFCALSAPCHADVVAELADAETGTAGPPTGTATPDADTDEFARSSAASHDASCVMVHASLPLTIACCCCWPTRAGSRPTVR